MIKILFFIITIFALVMVLYKRIAKCRYISIRDLLYNINKQYKDIFRGKKSDLKILPPYGRILAFNERGKDILSKAKGSTAIPFDTSIARLSQKSEEAKRYASLEVRASDIYGLSLEQVNSAQKDYRSKISIDIE